MKVVLVESSGENIGKIYPVLSGSEIGRSKDIAISLDEKIASRKHAYFKFERSSVFITDLGSANGTYVNAKKIDSRTELFSGDYIRIGNTTLKISIAIKKKKRTQNSFKNPTKTSNIESSSNLVETGKSQIEQFSPLDLNAELNSTQEEAIAEQEISGESRMSIEIKKGMEQAAKESELEITIKEKAIITKDQRKEHFWDKFGLLSEQFNEFTGWIKTLIILGLIGFMVLLFILFNSLLSADNTLDSSDDNLIKFVPIETDSSDDDDDLTDEKDIENNENESTP